MPPIKRAKIAEPVLGRGVGVAILHHSLTPHGRARTDLGSLPLVDGQTRKRASGEAAGVVIGRESFR